VRLAALPPLVKPAVRVLKIDPDHALEYTRPETLKLVIRQRPHPIEQMGGELLPGRDVLRRPRVRLAGWRRCISGEQHDPQIRLAGFRPHSGEAMAVLA